MALLNTGTGGSSGYAPGGTDVAVADGGTGASTAAAALTNLGITSNPPRSRKTGKYYTILESSGDATTAPTKDQAVYVPFPVWGAITIDRISLGVGAAGGATSVVRLGIYNSDTNGEPTTVLIDAGTIDGTSATYQEITVSQALAANTLYFACVTWQVGTVTAGTLRTLGTGNGSQWISMAANNVDPRACTFTQAGVTGAYATAGTLAAGITTPFAVKYRVA